MADVWTGFLQGMAAFGQTRAARLVATSFKDTGSFLAPLLDGAGDDNTREDPFTSANAATCAMYLGEVLAAFDEGIAGITEPWKKPFRELGASATGDFDKAARQLFNIQNASTRVADV